jgi:hypothetical protein
MGLNELTYNELIMEQMRYFPIKKKEDEKMKWKCFNCDQIVAVEKEWPDGARCPFCGGGPVRATLSTYPLGTFDKYEWNSMRSADIKAAIERYLEHGGIEIPPEWIEEYNEIIRRRSV